MRATIEFDLPDDEAAHLRAVKAWDMYSALVETRDYLKTQGGPVYTKFQSILESNCLRLSELGGGWSEDDHGRG